MAAVLAAVFGIALASVVSTAALASPAGAGVAGLTVGVDRPLSLVGEAISVTVGGRLSGSLEGDRLVVRIKGPAEPSQVGQSAPELPEVGKIVVELGAVSTPTAGAGPTGEGTSPDLHAGGAGEEGETAGQALRLGSLVDMRAGILEAEVGVPAGLAADPGAYLVVAEVRSAGESISAGQIWVGRAAPRDVPLDVAFVWPVSLGIHRNADGVFFDRVLEEAVSASDGAGDLGGVPALSSRFSDWDFTLAIEPILLTQLRDMADGYTRADVSGAEVQVAADALPARNAAEVLKAFAVLAEDPSVEMIVGPYSGADLGLLAAEGWYDGLQQIQMGKQEVQQTLGLAIPPAGGYSPGLTLTSDGLSCYAGASIDYVVVSQALATLLTEPVTAGTDAVRARNAENDRVTLVLANDRLAARLTAPWDSGVFVAALAAELTGESEEAIVVTPSIEFGLVPTHFLERIGEILAGVDWIRTQTLAGLLRTHGPDTRPVLLKTGAAGTTGYVEESLLAGLRIAHAVVSDLAAMADPTRAPVAEALRLLYTAESRWWSRPETSPEEATIGMEYAEKARQIAMQEMGKIRFLDPRPLSIVGDEGTVGVVVQNDTGYPATVRLGLEGTGATLSEERLLDVELAVGRNEIPVRVLGTGGSQEVRAVLLAGGTVLDEAGYPVRFVTVWTILPGVIVGVAVVTLGVFLALRWTTRRRKAGKTA